MSDDGGGGGGSAKKTKQGAGKRLNDKQRVEIIQISENSKISKRQLAEKYGVSEAAIRKLLLKKDEFLKRYYDTPEEIRDQRLRGRNSISIHDTDGSGTLGAHANGVALVAGAAADGSVDANRAAAMNAAPVHVKTQYPPDDPWKQGLLALAGKVTPFLKSFVNAKAPMGIDAQTAPPLAGASTDWIGFARMLRDIRRAFHRYPELGYHEMRAQAFIRRFCESTLEIPSQNIRALASTGLVVDVGYNNGAVTPSDKRKAPVLAFRADMDAVPIEELNDHLPYCSTQTTTRKDQRKRKKRKSASIAATTLKLDELSAGVSGVAGLRIGEDGDGDVPMPLVDGDECEAPMHSSACAAAHVCGHDGHMAVVIGLCALIVRNAHLLPPDAFVRFIFQPAEEGPGGAKRMIEEGALDGVDEVYGLHNYPFPLYNVHIRPGPVMAHEVEFAIDIHGVGGHGSAPQDCIDPIYAGAMVVQALQSIVSRTLAPTDTAVLSVTQFRGGDTNNVIPSHVILGGTIRDFDLDVAEKIKSRVEAIVQSTCTALGATAQVHFADGYAPVINPYDETRLVQQVAVDMGLYMSELGLPLMTSEDFSYFLQARKGCLVFLGTKEDGDDDATRALHSPQYDFNDKALPLGIRLFLGILQARTQCELYSLDDLQAFQLAMERIALSNAVSMV